MFLIDYLLRLWKNNAIEPKTDQPCAPSDKIMAPQVELTTTLEQLYSLDGGSSKNIALVYAFPYQIQLAASLPVSHKYAYQGPRTIKASKDDLARFYLGCLAQYYGFVAGPMDLHLFDLDEPNGLQPAARTHRIDAEDIYRQLQESQRPRLHFVEDASQVAALEQHKAVITPMDFLDGNKPLVDQEAHWDLLSKRTLALSTLPSPPTEVIDSILHPDQKADKVILDIEIDRMLKRIALRPLPFVVKLPLGLGGHAVFIVKKESQREECLTILRAELPTMFQSLTWENEAKKPVSLLIQDIVPGPSAGVSIFVTKAGRAIYISTSAQILNDRDQWNGGLMDYTAQEAQEELYHDIILKVADFAAKRGYVGPLGVDVMTDENGRQLIVDMNVRQTGSYTLGLMKKHFYELRHLPVGGLVCPVPVMGDRKSFEKRFAKEIEDGSMVVTAWCHARGYSACGLVLGAESRERMGLMMKEVESVAIKT